MKNVDFLARLVNQRVSLTADLRLEFTYNATYDEVWNLVDHISRISWENFVEHVRREAYYVLDLYFVEVNLQPVIELSIAKAIVSSDILKCKINLKDVRDHGSGRSKRKT